MGKYRNFTVTILSQNFRESDFFTKELYSRLIWRKIFWMAVNSSFFHIVGEHNVEHIVEFTKFLKNFRENKFWTIKIFYESFSRKMWVAANSRIFYTVWKLRNFVATVVSQKIREINFLPKNFTLDWFDGKNICVAVIFSFFYIHKLKFWKFHGKLVWLDVKHCTVWKKREIHCHIIFFSSNQFRVKFYTKKLLSRNFYE